MSTPQQSRRFRDRREHIYGFTDEYLVVCPKCCQCGKVRRIDPLSREWFAPRRFICQHCGLTKDWKDGYTERSWRESPQDDYFHFPLWLQAPCCGHTLWAFNERHLGFIRDYVRAALRERRRDLEFGWSNRSLASRLPQWMQLAKNRAGILRVAEKLQAKLKGAESTERST